jgi:hypothetical protein
MPLDRRQLLTSTAGSVAAVLLSQSGVASSTGHKARHAVPPLIADIEERTFRFFWEQVNKKNGLMPDRWPTPSFASIAAVGFALTAYPIGVERGWITRQQARDITLTTLKFFDAAPMGDATSGVSGYRGFYYHFLDMETGLRFKDTELSTVDTAWLHMGVAFAQGWFDQDTLQEASIRTLAQRILDRAEWDWVQQHSTGGKAISMGWHPESGFIARNWDGYIEGMAVYILALGSRSHPVKDGAYEAWAVPYPKYWRGAGATRHLAFAPSFGHQWGPMWIDYRGIYDATMREAGFDYFENCRRAAYAQRAYAIANPMHWKGYSKDVWGLTACDGPGAAAQFNGKATHFDSYSARGPLGMPDENDDGTLAPTAALSFMPFAPEICIPAAEALRRQYGRHIYGRYGFFDSFNPSLTDTQVHIEKGKIDPHLGWVDDDYLSVDQGPILGMIANYRSEIIWAATRKVPNLIHGLKRAGFAGGWLSA